MELVILMVAAYAMGKIADMADMSTAGWGCLTFILGLVALVALRELPYVRVGLVCVVVFAVLTAAKLYRDYRHDRGDGAG